MEQLKVSEIEREQAEEQWAISLKKQQEAESAWRQSEVTRKKEEEDRIQERTIYQAQVAWASQQLKGAQEVIQTSEADHAQLVKNMEEQMSNITKQGQDRERLLQGQVQHVAEQGKATRMVLEKVEEEKNQAESAWEHAEAIRQHGVIEEIVVEDRQKCG